MKLFYLILLIIGFLFPNFMIKSISYTNSDLSDKVVDFSTNILVSSNDYKYSYHVEPTFAIGQNNEIFTGWKEANGPSSGGLDVSF
jgi:hypothetical protein